MGKILLVWTVFVLSMELLFSPDISAQKQYEEPTMEEVVVTATKTEIPIEQLGVSSRVITHKEIESRGTRYVHEILREVTGLDLSQTGSRGGITEIYARGGESNFTLILIDGIKINKGGGDVDLSNLTVDNVERIEIIKGPHSAIYGSDAMGGVINIITKRGRGKPEITISSIDGFHSENGRFIGEQNFMFSGGTEFAGYSFTYGRTEDRGILEVNNIFTNNTFSGRVDLYPMEKCDIGIFARYWDSRLGLPTEVGGDRPDRSFPGLDPDQWNEMETTTIGVKAKLSLTQWWEQEILIGANRHEEKFGDPPDMECAFDYAPGYFSNAREERNTVDYHWNLHLKKERIFSSVFTVGGEYKSESFNFEDNYFNRASKRRSNGAFYLQEQLSLWDRLFLTGGLRYDNSSLFGEEVSPRGSAAFLISETGTKLRAAAGKGIKEPTFFENYGIYLGVAGNPDLRPEKAFGWEVGLDQDLFGKKAKFTINYFQNSYKDLIAFSGYLPFPSGKSYENIQEAKSRGCEFDFKGELGMGMSLSMAYTFLETEVIDDGGLKNPFFVEGKSLLRRPKHKLSIDLNGAWKDLRMNIRGTYVGKRDDAYWVAIPPFTIQSSRVRNDSYFLLDLTGSYRLPLKLSFLKEAIINLKARNLLDEDYEEVYGYSSPRLSIMSGIVLKF